MGAEEQDLTWEVLELMYDVTLLEFLADIRGFVLNMIKV